MAVGFKYTAINTSRVGSYRHVFCLCENSGHTHTAVGYFQLNTATGLQSITGLGFEPELIGLMGVDLVNEDSDFDSAFHLGFATATAEWGGSTTGRNNEWTWNALRRTYWRDNAVVALAGLRTAVASLDSFDANGFTLNVTTAPSDGIRVYYFAARGGEYAVGTSLAPTSTGTQAISGLGFRPGGVFFSWGAAGALDTFNTGVYFGTGGADEGEQYSIVGGCRYGAPQQSARVDTGKAITFITAANGGGGAGRSIDAQAAVDSLDADGFTLDWTTAGAGSRYFSWLAVGGQVEVERFLFTYPGDEVLTDNYGPTVAVLGFGSDQAVEGWEPQRVGSGTGVSFCGTPATSPEYSCSYGELFPFTLSISNCSRDAGPGSCGAHPIDDNDPITAQRNRVNIYDATGTRRTQFIRRPYG